VSAGRLAVIAVTLMVLGPIGAAAQVQDFSDVGTASLPPASVIGGHARGCLAGGQALMNDNGAFQVMRPSRNRFWGHPELIAFITQFAEQVNAEGWPGLLIGDLAQPRGGPMASGHRSHQSGLDVDIWFLAAPRRLSAVEREEISALSMVAEDGETMSPDWTPAHARLLQVAASFPQVDRIFVNPAIKRTLCNDVAGDRSWLAKVRPWWGHDAHFHVGLHCPLDATECLERTPPVPDGDGCDASLDWWFSAAARDELRQAAAAPRPRLTIDELPSACRSVLTSE
jgi:penicillin-insensitive murein endopeptidase